MAVGPWMLFLGMVLVVSGLPLYFATLRGRTRTGLLLGHMALLQLTPSFLVAPYAIPLAPGLEVTPGNILFMGLLLTVFLLVVVERRARVLRAAVLVVLAVSLAEVALLATTWWATSSPSFVQLAVADPDVFATLAPVVSFGDLLVIAELLVFVVLSQRVLRLGRGRVVLAIANVAVFAAVALTDGVVFSVARSALDGSVASSPFGGAGAKLFLSVVFGVPLLAFMLLGEQHVRSGSHTALRVRDVLVPPPRRAVVQRLERERVELLERTLHVAEDERLPARRGHARRRDPAADRRGHPPAAAAGRVAGDRPRTRPAPRAGRGRLAAPAHPRAAGAGRDRCELRTAGPGLRPAAGAAGGVDGGL